MYDIAECVSRLEKTMQSIGDALAALRDQEPEAASFNLDIASGLIERVNNAITE